MKNLNNMLPPLPETDLALYGVHDVYTVEHMKNYALLSIKQISKIECKWTPVTTRYPAHPGLNNRKVVCFTDGYDYGGTKFITIDASEFYEYDENEPDNPGTQETKTVSHWVYEDDLINSILACEAIKDCKS